MSAASAAWGSARPAVLASISTVRPSVSCAASGASMVWGSSCARSGSTVWASPLSGVVSTVCPASGTKLCSSGASTVSATRGAISSTTASAWTSGVISACSAGTTGFWSIAMAARIICSSSSLPSFIPAWGCWGCSISWGPFALSLVWASCGFCAASVFSGLGAAWASALCFCSSSFWKPSFWTPSLFFPTWGI